MGSGGSSDQLNVGANSHDSRLEKLQGGREGLSKGSMREKEMWVREGAGRDEARAGGGREAGKGEEKEGQWEERKLGQKKKHPQKVLKKYSSYHYKSNIKYNIKVTFYTEIIHMAHSISYGAFVLW